MATAQETFRKTVIEALEININNRKLSYVNYLELPANQISNDEDAVVDVQFTSNILKWLGYEAGDIIYNRPIPGRPTDKPDFVVKMLGVTGHSS